MKRNFMARSPIVNSTLYSVHYPWSSSVHHCKWYFVRSFALNYNITIINFEGKHDHTNTFIFMKCGHRSAQSGLTIRLVFWFYVSTIIYYYPFKIAPINSMNACWFIKIHFNVSIEWLRALSIECARNFNDKLNIENWKPPINNY